MKARIKRSWKYLSYGENSLDFENVLVQSDEWLTQHEEKSSKGQWVCGRVVECTGLVGNVVRRKSSTTEKWNGSHSPKANPMAWRNMTIERR